VRGIFDMKRFLQKSKLLTTAALFMAVLMMLQGFVSAQGNIKKEEDVYVSLGSSGEIEKAYVINSFTLSEPAVLEDYGDYEKVTNLTTTDGLKVEGDRITVSAPKGRFYYQGNISSVELPWIFEIEYKLDGKDISPQELSGANGFLEIAISIKPNRNARGGFDRHYAVQTTVTLDSSVSSEIEAEGATIANAGKDKTISYTLLPGNEALYRINAKVSDFYMEGIRFAAVPFSVSLDGIDMSSFEKRLKELDNLSDGIKELDNAAKELKNGTAELADGMASLRDGMKGWQAGLSQLNDSFSGLTMQNAGIMEGSLKIREGILSIAQSLPPQLLQLKEALESLAQSYTDFHSGLAAYIGATEEISKGYRELNQSYSQILYSYGQLYSGAYELAGGTRQLAEGTGQLRQGTANMGSEMEKAIDEFMASFAGDEFEPVSFVSDKNKNVEAVQFIMQTKGIEKKALEVVTEKTEKKATFWERFLALFGF